MFHARRTRLTPVLLLIATTCLSAGSRARASEDFLAFLVNDLGLDAKKVAKLDSEVLVERAPVENDKREIAVYGVVRIRIPAEEFVEAYRDPHGPPVSGQTQQIGWVNAPASVDDFADLELPEDDVKAMKDCRVGKCKLKLPVAAIEILETVDWAQPEAEGEAREAFRQGSAAYFNDYLAEGNRALVVYADQEERQSIEEGFDHLLSRATKLSDYLPELTEYLRQFPESRPPGVEDLYYWQVQDYSLQQVTSFGHAAIYSPSESDVGVVAAIGLKQIYASHYFQARWQLVLVFRDTRVPASPAMYAIYLDHSLFDGDLSWANRKLLGGQVEGATESLMKVVRDGFEAR